jgi:PAS domain S-box-containing protein
MRTSSETLRIEELKKEDKSLRNLVEIIHFTENVSAKIYGILDESDIYRTVTEEFAKSTKYNVAILLLTDDGSKLRIAETSLSPKKIKVSEKTIGVRSYGDYRIDLSKSSFFDQVIKGGKTIKANFVDAISELFPKPLALLTAQIIGYERRTGILTPLKQHEKIIGLLVIDSPELAEHFIPSVKNLAQHISTALELTHEQTERKQIEKKLQRDEKKYKELADLLPQIVFETDKEGNITFINQKAFETFGYTQEDFEKGLNALQVIAPEDRGKARENIQKRLRGEKFGPTEYKALKKDGSTFPAIIYTNPIIRENKPAGLRGIFIDITERKKVEENNRVRRKV